MFTYAHTIPPSCSGNTLLLLSSLSFSVFHSRKTVYTRSRFLDNEARSYESRIYMYITYTQRERRRGRRLIDCPRGNRRVGTHLVEERGEGANLLSPSSAPSPQTKKFLYNHTPSKFFFFFRITGRNVQDDFGA